MSPSDVTEQVADDVASLADAGIQFPADSAGILFPAVPAGIPFPAGPVVGITFYRVNYFLKHVLILFTRIFPHCRKVATTL